jgi:hypothetical protein
MQRINPLDFSERFPLPMMAASREVRGMHNGSVLIERDQMVSANIKGDVVIRRGAHALITGIINGSVEIEAGAIAYFNAIVRGHVTVRGAACVQGIVTGDVRVDPGATLALDGFEALVSGTVSDLTPSA